ncbi:hypothetical protein [Actinokineospora cianjurensis]|uniref:Uncharacterized protein n=1 Tax=Actinokineospora cianjurensis TaxID=585224 RepID=A0A421B467_9PSEU|nr:hypothetical protein [Actinokineospora cianjurensis]RLK59073.1 hypothetical protein CLV68_3555 [Actinokineospora cianjurensis]
MSRKRSTVVAAAMCAVVSAFQFALAAGAPFGRAAWGGTAAELSTGLRVASGVAVVLWAFAAVVLLRRGGLIAQLPEQVARRGSWVVVALLAAGALMNAASSSPWERYGWAPFILVHLVLSIRVATSPVGQRTA